MSARRSGRSCFGRSTPWSSRRPCRCVSPCKTVRRIRSFSKALHTYFAISDITGIAISGLAGTTYIDKSDAARRKPQTAALVTITAETDSVYLDTPGQCAIEDRGWRRRVVIKKDAAASSVVWNPWAEKAAAMVDLGDPAWRGMVCVETGNMAANEVRLPADGEHQMSTAISIDAGP